MGSKKQNLFEMGANFNNSNWNLETKEPNKHQLVFLYEKRRGKPVTVIKPFHLEKKDLQNTLKTIKKKLGTGGTIAEDRLELQGDVKEKVKEVLEEMGFRFKRK